MQTMLLLNPVADKVKVQSRDERKPGEQLHLFIVQHACDAVQHAM